MINALVAMPERCRSTAPPALVSEASFQRGKFCVCPSNRKRAIRSLFSAPIYMRFPLKDNFQRKSHVDRFRKQRTNGTFVVRWASTEVASLKTAFRNQCGCAVERQRSGIAASALVNSVDHSPLAVLPRTVPSDFLANNKRDH